MLLLQPAASLALAALILGQQPTGLQILGAILTCGGALAASLSSTKAARAATAVCADKQMTTAAETV